MSPPDRRAQLPGKEIQKAGSNSGKECKRIFMRGWCADVVPLLALLDPSVDDERLGPGVGTRGKNSPLLVPIQWQVLGNIA
jgi:hypothetical protein